MRAAKTLILFGAALGASFLLLEIGFRVFFELRVGPGVLFYGISAARQTLGPGTSASYHDNIAPDGSYSKYFPHQDRYHEGVGSQRRVHVTINDHGFRGEDFEVEKPAGVLRVIALGSSSTFGYGNEDDETWPHFLEQILREQILGGRCPGPGGVEVLNLAIPHLRTGSILALFRAEALPLDPDVVLFYEGANDSRGEPDVRKPPWDRLGFSAGAAGGRLVSLDFARSILAANRRYSAADVEEALRGKSGVFLGNLAAIDASCRERGIAFVVANQQSRSLTLGRDEIRGVRYAEEVALVRERLAAKGSLKSWALYFLVHAALMRDLEVWASGRGVPFVDAIGALDADRDHLVTYVHLSPEGNRRLAAAFAERIEEIACGAGAARVRPRRTRGSRRARAAPRWRPGPGP